MRRRVGVAAVAGHRACDLRAARGRVATTALRVVTTVLAVLSLSLAGCDSGPEGPGSITAFASGPDLGGAVLEVRGGGIRGFSARGSSRVYSAPVQGRVSTYRVIVISPDTGELAFDIEVDDLGMEGPTVELVSVADGQNRAFNRAEASIRLVR